MREHFLLDPGTVFLNHGSFGACPREVLEAQRSLQLEMERNPVDFLARRSASLLREARGLLAAHLGAKGSDLVFVPNATTGVNIVARSLEFTPGDEVLTTDHEYGACDNTWDWVAERRGAVVRRVEIPLPFRPAEFLDRLWAGVTPRTRLIFVSHLTSTTGLVFPLEGLCRRAREGGILSLVDGAHAPGQLDLDLDALGADFYTGNGHKWLCAPKGAGFLHARAEHHEKLHAPVVSWGYSAASGGHRGFESYTGESVLERRLQWQGTRDLSAFLAVPAAIEFQRRHAWPALRAQCHRLAVEALARHCAEHGVEPIAEDGDFAQMACLPFPAADPEDLRRALFERFCIEVPVTRHRGRVFVRVSVQAYNTESDLEALHAALRRIAAERG
ncbi:MAG: aminotransferase class V-fold PLP-dependent enzyme [Acidobacteria bacterium]|nr:aminotransferase class V-fold PLP-dependent enzyme [Acidobacteriota bacterium]